MSLLSAAPADLASPRLGRLIRRLALPSVVGLSINALYHIVDAFFVGRLGPEAVAAVSLAFPLLILLVALAEGFGVGAAATIARLLGARRRVRAGQAATLALAMSAATAVVATALLLPVLEPALLLLGATPTALPLALPYTALLVGGSVMLFLQIGCDFIAIAEGNSRFSMLTLLGSFLLNMILDPVFIFWLDMGVPGAALATLVAQVSALAAYAVYFGRRLGTVRLHPRLLRHGRGTARRIVTMGTSAALATGLTALAFMLIYRLAGAHGDAALAGVGIALRLLAGGTLPVMGFCLGTQPILGYAWGAGDPARVRRALRLMLAATTAFAAVHATAMIAFAPQVVGLFTDDAATIAIGTQAVRVFHLFHVAFGLYMVTVALLQATGRPKPAALLLLAPRGLFLIPALLVLPPLFGLDGLIASQALAGALSALLAAAVLRATLAVLQPAERPCTEGSA